MINLSRKLLNGITVKYGRKIRTKLTWKKLTKKSGDGAVGSSTMVTKVSMTRFLTKYRTALVVLGSSSLL